MRAKVSVHDGDGTRPSGRQSFGAECRGCWVFTVSSKQPVTVVDLNLLKALRVRIQNAKEDK